VSVRDRRAPGDIALLPRAAFREIASRRPRQKRGPGGGYLLTHGRTATRISDIILAVDEPIRAVRCKPGTTLGCRGDRSRCLTHDLWEELSNQIHLYLSSVTLEDVCEKRVLGTSGLTYRASAAAQ
jgi:Rrf2 family iron-sulfur cluster assembly transcriptional regulator